MDKTEWILCPLCGSKTRNKVREDTVLINYPLYCPKCRQEKERTMIMSLLEVTGLTHSFGESYLFKNADFTLNKGEHIGIVGQNGAGKSIMVS